MKEKFVMNEIDHDAQLSWNLWEYHYQKSKSEFEFSKSGYDFNPIMDSNTSLPNMLINYHKVDSLADMEPLISRYTELGRSGNEI
jgi:uncharacterized protein (DUF885 family)